VVPCPLETSQTDFQGTERFQVVRRLGQGGMGLVYEALDREKGTRVALNTLLRSTPDALIRFKREFRALADITHPNLVELGELFEHQGVWFFSMELVTGVAFSEWVRPGWDARAALEPRNEPHTQDRGGSSSSDGPTRSSGDLLAEALRPFPLREDRLRAAIPQLVRGLAARHAAGKIHRDVKPSWTRSRSSAPPGCSASRSSSSPGPNRRRSCARGASGSATRWRTPGAAPPRRAPTWTPCPAPPPPRPSTCSGAPPSSCS
jgi:hypothetical protein